MYYLADQDKAKRVLAELREARLGERDEVLATLQRLRNDVATERVDEIPRIEAWIAIRNLYDTFKLSPSHDLKATWQDAINKTLAWQASLR